jgi:hypothetical protein
MEARVTHEQREQRVLDDLTANFPTFAGQALAWSKVPDGQDPPDFLGTGQKGPVGLELVEWLDGDQMGPAKGREDRRKEVLRILRRNWEAEYRPRNFRGAFIRVGNKRIVASDEADLRKEFFERSAEVDRTWVSNPQRRGMVYEETELTRYRLMDAYFAHIRYIGGEPHGFCWIDVDGDAGACDPFAPVDALNGAMDKKLNYYGTPEKQAHLKTQNLAELVLLLHGGFNAFAYNTPSFLPLEDIAQRGAAFYATHPNRDIFNRVWMFESLNSADDINELIGYPTGHGRVRWLARLWPDFEVYEAR